MTTAIGPIQAGHRMSMACTVKKVSDFPVLSQDVTDQTLPGIIKLLPARKSWFVKSRLGTGKSVTFFTVWYGSAIYCVQYCYCFGGGGGPNLYQPSKHSLKIPPLPFSILYCIKENRKKENKLRRINPGLVPAAAPPLLSTWTFSRVGNLVNKKQCCRLLLILFCHVGQKIEIELFKVYTERRHIQNNCNKVKNAHDEAFSVFGK